jgi:aminoglycoside phosphotransferase (APT) family kinase protein
MDSACSVQRQLCAMAGELRSGATRIAALRRLTGGASQQSWYFEVEAAAQPPLPMVLRRAGSGSAPRGVGSVALAAEAQLIERAAAAGVPVPAVVAVLRPEHGLGPGFVMQHVVGETLGRRIVAAPQLAAARDDLAYQCGQALARIHGIDDSALPPLRKASAGDERASYAAQHRAHGRPKPVFELALQWLAAHDIGAPARHALVHGDFRNGNLVVDAHGLRAVLDWELAHVGDPMEDLGWLCVEAWRFGRSDLPVGGFGTRQALFDGYRDAGGTPLPERVHYWQVFGSLKWGVICEGMAASHLSGAEPAVEHAAIGRRASEAEIDLALLAPLPL